MNSSCRLRFVDGDASEAVSEDLFRNGGEIKGPISLVLIGFIGRVARGCPRLERSLVMVIGEVRSSALSVGLVL